MTRSKGMKQAKSDGDKDNNHEGSTSDIRH